MKTLSPYIFWALGLGTLIASLIRWFQSGATAEQQSRATSGILTSFVLFGIGTILFYQK